MSQTSDSSSNTGATNADATDNSGSASSNSDVSGSTARTAPAASTKKKMLKCYLFATLVVLLMGVLIGHHFNFLLQVITWVFLSLFILWIRSFHWFEKVRILYVIAPFLTLGVFVFGVGEYFGRQNCPWLPQIARRGGPRTSPFKFYTSTTFFPSEKTTSLVIEIPKGINDRHLLLKFLSQRLNFPYNSDGNWSRLDGFFGSSLF
jgi:hypothetical protein